jgi:hypothetical protein
MMSSLRVAAFGRHDLGLYHPQLETPNDMMDAGRALRRCAEPAAQIWRKENIV